MTRPSIVVPLDGTPQAREAIPVARVLAAAHGALLRFVHVGAARAAAEEVRDRMGLAPAELEGGVLDVRAGDPVAGIVDAAREAHALYLVMCTHTAAHRMDGALGSTAAAVLRGAPCPLVLVRPRGDARPWDLRSIVVPHDGSPSASAALQPAGDLARRAGAELSILHIAQEGARRPPEPGTVAVSPYMDQPQHDWPDWQAEFLERLACFIPLDRIAVRLSVVHGDPAAEAVRFAAEHRGDLLVMVCPEAYSDERCAAVDEVLGRAPCPVLILRV